MEHKTEVKYLDFSWTSYAQYEIGDKCDVDWLIKYCQKQFILTQFTQEVVRIVIIPIVFQLNKLNKFPEKRFYSVRKKTLTIAKHFDYDTFLDSSKEACEKILLAGFLEEFKHIKQMRGMKKVNFDVDAFCGKVKALTEKMECQKMS